VNLLVLHYLPVEGGMITRDTMFLRTSTWRELRGEARDRCTQVGITVATKGVPLTCTMISIPLMILCHTAGDQTAAEPTMSVAGTMVWSKRIVMAHLQVICSVFGREGDPVGHVHVWHPSRLSKASATLGQPEEEWRKACRAEISATVWGLLADDRSENPHHIS
jgi:hypothetical protein